MEYFKKKEKIKLKELNFIYISLSGNTEYFVNQLKKKLQNEYEINLINVKQLVKDRIDFFKVDKSFIVFVPTYLEGGNGIDNGHNEILTTSLREFVRSYENYKNCIGVIGSGNKNFNNQYCLTAKQYSQEFKVPFLADFELRGNNKDIERIGNLIKGIIK